MIPSGTAVRAVFNLKDSKMNRAFALLLTVVIVGGVSVGTALLTDLFASEEVSGIVSVLVGCAFGTFALDIYRAFRLIRPARGSRHGTGTDREDV
jgi:hypothetical protein